MSADYIPPFIYLRDRQNNLDLMIFTSTIRYIAEDSHGHTAITFSGGGTQEVAHTIPEIVEILGGDRRQAENDLATSQALTVERSPLGDPYADDDYLRLLEEEDADVEEDE